MSVMISNTERHVNPQRMEMSLCCAWAIFVLGKLIIRTWYILPTKMILSGIVLIPEICFLTELTVLKKLGKSLYSEGRSRVYTQGILCAFDLFAVIQSSSTT